MQNISQNRAVNIDPTVLYHWSYKASVRVRGYNYPTWPPLHSMYLSPKAAHERNAPVRNFSGTTGVKISDARTFQGPLHCIGSFFAARCHLDSTTGHKYVPTSRGEYIHNSGFHNRVAPSRSRCSNTVRQVGPLLCSLGRRRSARNPKWRCR